MQTPNDCALLITAPITERDFLSDLHHPNKDFVKNWAKTQRLASDADLTDAALWNIYSFKMKDFILETAAEIESFGVKIVFNAKLENLRQIFAEKKIIILEAYWFSPEFEVSDFYNPSSFVKNLCESDEMVAKVLREALFATETGLSAFSDFFNVCE